MEKLRAEGEASELAAGEAWALAKGKSEGFTRLLERRFGPLGQAVLDRIVGADLDQLDAWIERVMDAESRKAVFGKGR
ncbi:hypothetical protein [Hoeflea sp.]|uniref:hypothetical protein n=1 Tax=Hoeflea sp. TaxID=1940281 RepID=UPI003B02EC58